MLLFWKLTLYTAICWDTMVSQMKCILIALCNWTRMSVLISHFGAAPWGLLQLFTQRLHLYWHSQVPWVKLPLVA